ncbi:MAG: DUF721 domain-containing protein [Deltaproteobacteria bacterium]|nr:DUF721 domain-containing protein [Deltaproteobacteria bacterium]
MARRNKHYESIGVAHIGTLLAESIGDKAMVRQALGVWPAWEQAVGPQVARCARPVALRDGVLVVHVAHPVWLQELTPIRAILLAKVQKLAGAAVVRELRLKVGILPRAEQARAVVEAPKAELRAPIPYELARCIRAVPSSGLRSVLLRVAAKWAAQGR